MISGNQVHICLTCHDLTSGRQTDFNIRRPDSVSVYWTSYMYLHLGIIRNIFCVCLRLVN